MCLSAESYRKVFFFNHRTRFGWLLCKTTKEWIWNSKRKIQLRVEIKNPIVTVILSDAFSKSEYENQCYKKLRELIQGKIFNDKDILMSLLTVLIKSDCNNESERNHIKAI